MIRQASDKLVFWNPPPSISPTNTVKVPSLYSPPGSKDLEWEDFLHQNSFHEVDTYSSLQKQYLLMKLVIAFYEQSKEALDKGANIQGLIKMDVREKIGRFKYVTEDKLDKEYKATMDELAADIANVFGKEDF